MFARSLRGPLAWLWRSVLSHLAAALYGLGLQVHRSVAGHTEGGWFSGLFTHRHTITAAVLVVASCVIAGNIYASDDPAQAASDGERSPMSYFTEDFEEELLVEEADEDIAPASDTEHLEGLVVGQDDYLAIESDREQKEGGESAREGTDEIPVMAVEGLEAGVIAENLTPTRTTVTVHEVVAGETVDSIARHYGLKTATVIQTNGLNSYGLIRPGQKLQILPVDGILYKTRKGDTVTKIAKTYQSDAAQIAEFNRLPDWGTLDVGVELVLPGGKMPAPPKPKVTAPAYIPPSPQRDTAIGKLLWPTGCTRITQYYKRSHLGLDIACPIRTPIYAAESGVVIFSGWNRGGYGNMVVIDHGDSLYTRYAHATKLLVKAGDTVKRGDAIALMGSTGRSTGSHLHFEVMVGSTSRRMNPLDYLR